MLVTSEHISCAQLQVHATDSGNQKSSNHCFSKVYGSSEASQYHDDTFWDKSFLRVTQKPENDDNLKIYNMKDFTIQQSCSKLNSGDATRRWKEDDYYDTQFALSVKQLFSKLRI